MYEYLAVSPSTWAVAFLSMTGLEIAWVFYTKAMVASHPLRASFWASLIHLFGAISVLVYVGDHRYITATMLGVLIGTYGAVRVSKKLSS